MHPNNFDAVRQLAHALPGAVYCLGIHPLYVQQCSLSDLVHLEDTLKQHHHDPKLAAVGEIGLDGFIANPNWEKQIQFYHAQLKLAKQLNYPVVLHVRKAQDKILQGLRRFPPQSGIAHAFNGSTQQAHQFIQQGIKLGFGGALTYQRANQIRRLVCELPLNHIVLETDSPDIPPAWLSQQRNEPMHIAQIAQVIADLRHIDLTVVQQQTNQNAYDALPALRHSNHSP